MISLWLVYGQLMDHITLREDTQKNLNQEEKKKLFSMKGTKEPLRGGTWTLVVRPLKKIYFFVCLVSSFIDTRAASQEGISIGPSLYLYQRFLLGHTYGRNRWALGYICKGKHAYCMHVCLFGKKLQRTKKVYLWSRNHTTTWKKHFTISSLFFLEMHNMKIIFFSTIFA